MKQFMLSDSVQLWINSILGLWTIIGITVMFIVPTEYFDSIVWYPISTVASLITCLVYNVWVSDKLN